MARLLVSGGNELFGSVQISSAKNACLPIISSCILFDGCITLNRCPLIKDVLVMAEIIRDLNGDYFYKNNSLVLNCSTINKFEGNCERFKRARASFFTAGALLSRFKKAVVPLPGGCDLGARPIDIHIDVFKQLKIECDIHENCVILNAEKAKSGNIRLRFPSVGATVNAINASVYLSGITVINNCAKEPEIEDLCNFLNKCGCKISGGGSSIITVEGVNPISLKKGVFYTPIFDRIEAGTYVMAVCACGGEIKFNCDGVAPIRATLETVEKMGARVKREGKRVIVSCFSRLKSVDVTADVYPAFPTDMQPQFCAVACKGLGTSFVCDRVFKHRFNHLEQLALFGANVSFDGEKAKIVGREKLFSASVLARDLRGGAALVIAALSSSGQSVINGIEVTERGYENFYEKICLLGGKVRLLDD